VLAMLIGDLERFGDALGGKAGEMYVSHLS
jgi:hypothetical protein